jgi:signal transduction histidine kinase
MVRGILWPQSVFGVSTSSDWRWLEHAGWVLFEDTFLFISIRQSLRDMFEGALRRAELESSRAEIERKVVERTADLTAAQKQLLDLTRHAGMTEVATDVLHNVGNVLNSVNVAADIVTAKVRQFRVGNLAKVAALVRENSADLGHFFEHDPRGREIPEYLVKLAESLSSPQEDIINEVAALKKNVNHIHEIVSVQQGAARRCRVFEQCSLSELAEDAIRINSTALQRHGISVIRQYGTLPAITTDRHLVLQILVNLVANAKYALAGVDDKKLVIRLSDTGRTRMAAIEVTDNGMGIARENLTRIFQHGFTTRKDGHGFGLHSGALAARTLGGSLNAYSQGAGMGATFTLRLPLGGKAVAGTVAPSWREATESLESTHSRA